MEQVKNFKLPATVEKSFLALLGRLTPLVPSVVHSFYVYGSLARGKAFTENSDINLLVLLNSDLPGDLSKVGAALGNERKGARVSLLVVGRDELQPVMDAFPVKFHNIDCHQVCLAGENLFKQLDVDRNRLVENARQGLWNLSLRLKRLCVELSPRQDLLLEEILELVSPLLMGFQTLLEFRHPPLPAKREEIVGKLCGLIGTDPNPILALLALKKGGALPSGFSLEGAIKTLLSAISRAARL